MSTTASLIMHNSAEPSLLRFGTWSIALHLGIVTLFSVIQATNTIDEAPPVVHVTLIETPVSKPAKKDAPAEAPPPMTARHSGAQRPQAIPPSPVLSSIPSTPMTVSQVAPLPTIPAPPQPLERRILHDHHATDSLNLKNYSKTAQRRTTQPAKSTSKRPQWDMPALPSTMVASIPSPTAVQPGRQPNLPGSDQPAVLKAAPSRAKGISRTKVGLVRTDPPVYPRIAREAGWEGTVIVRVVVKVDGTPDSAHVRKSSGHPILDEAAIEAVKHWRFVPAQDGNIPVRQEVDIPINFDLRQQG